MSLIELLVCVVLIGLVVQVHLIDGIVTVPAWLKTVINVLACLVVIVWLLEVMGFHSGIHLHLR